MGSKHGSSDFFHFTIGLRRLLCVSVGENLRPTLTKTNHGPPLFLTKSRTAWPVP